LQRSTLAKRAWLLFFPAAFLLYLYGTGRVPLIGPDEPRYAQIAREMLARRDLVTPTLGGHPWFEKPALLYWMMMAAFRVFGVSEWAARVGPSLSGLLTGLFVYLTGRRVERMVEDESEGAEEVRGLGLWSGVALLSSAGMIVFSRGASFDVVVTMTIAAALASFMMAELATVETKRKAWMAAFYAAVGASLLAKGLIGIVIPAGVVTIYYLLRREWPARSLLKSLLWGVPLALLVAAAWYGPVTLRHGWTFIDQFIIQHHFARYLSNKYHHPQPFYFYLPVLALLALPWTPLLVAALWGARRWAWPSAAAPDRLRVFAFVWLVVPVVFFSLSGSKLPGYILPALPGAALLVGDRLRSFVRGGGALRAMRATGVVLLLLAAAIVAFYLATMGQWVWPRALAIASPFLLAGLFVLARTRERVWSAALVVGATFAATVLTINLVLDEGARRESVRDLLMQASVRGYSSAPVLELHTVERTAEFYAAGRVARGGPDNDIIKFEGVGEIAEAARERGGTALVIVPLEYTEQLMTYAPLEAAFIGDNGEVALVAVRVRG
jgi:4-amino-4-deoxy-L-arabinose transferase-like glycosyltransferase